MRINLWCLLCSMGLLLTQLTAFGQTTSNQELPAIALPKHWLGNWKGKLKIEKAGSETQELDMELWISPGPTPNRWNWKSYMGQGEDKVVKEYELKALDVAKGKYQIDEKNSILLDAIYWGNRLTSIYEVNNLLIHLSYFMDERALHFEIHVFNSKKPYETGGQEGIPLVVSYPFMSSQKAILYRED